MPTLRIGVVVAGLMSACAPEFTIPEGARITCASDAQCPQGYECRVERCIASDANEAPTEDWENLSEQEKLKPRYTDWKFDWIDVPEIMNATREVFEFPVYDRNPLRQWTFGRVTLLGDAAHPLIPVSSNGAVQAILDGRALAYALASNDDPLAGLRAYEADRLKKANKVVRSSRENGPDEVLEIARERCPEGATNINDYVSQQELQAVIDEFKEAAGFGIETLNSRPSYNVA